jgi:phospholipase/carboxylesterase
VLECVELQTSSAPAASVIWLHGLGADGYDFVPVVKELNTRGAPPTRYVFPHAPMIPVTINNGFVMRAWYDIRTADLAHREDEAGIRASQAEVEQLIEREVGRGTPRNRIVLAGFSQGGAITLHTGLRQAEPLAGLIALSAYLPLVEQFAGERHPASAQVPVLMAHGTEDPVVPIARAARSRDLLGSLSYAMQWHEYPMPHSVCGEEIEVLAAFLRKRLG